MLQDTEYRIGRYIKWFWRTRDFRTVMKRRTLEITRKVKLLLLLLRLTQILLFTLFVASVYFAIIESSIIWGVIAALVFIFSPFILAYGITIPLILGYIFIQKPQERAIIERARKIYKKHPAACIAVVGSFGKTTAKEILLSVLSYGDLKVAATPGNMNTVIGVSRFASSLKGDEDILIVEFGEERVGDVKQLSHLVRPTMGIITGINESHLQSFKSIDQTVATIFELTDYLGDKVVYKNIENELVRKHAKQDQFSYSAHGVNDWVVGDVETSLHGTKFVATKDHTVIHVHTKLIGIHTVGVTVSAIAIAHDHGLTKHQIEKGLESIKPFEHRMEPRQLHGAWIIDDTYNGNSDGVAAGLALLKDSKATRRIYVTPGLVEQGEKTEQVHYKIGEQIANSADIVVLMRNSVTDFIIVGLDSAQFGGELIIIDNPLDFYTNLDQFIAAGDVVLMQNDWTDNYA